MKYLISIAAIFSVNVWAQSTPPNFDLVQFTNLVAVVASTGAPTAMADGSTWKTLQHTIPANTRVSHHLDYVDDVGYAGADGQYRADQLIVGWEDWQLGSDSNWTIDQWIYDIDLTGAVIQIYHGQMTENQSGEVIDDLGDLVDVTDAAALTALSQKLQYWYAAR